MAKNSKIEWTHHTFNPWRGCTKVAAGCANCYAARQAVRFPKNRGIWGPDGTRVVASEDMWGQPLKWNKAAAVAADLWRAVNEGRPDEVAAGRYTYDGRPRVFCASLADVFEAWDGPMVDHKGSQLFRHPNAARRDYIAAPYSGLGQPRVPVTMAAVRRDVFNLIDDTPNLDWLVLTKRPENIPPRWMIPANGRDPIDPLYLRRENVWLGTSIACQADLPNIAHLRKCRDLAPVLFLSIEPLIEDLGPIDLTGIDWVIVGGESGPGARPMHPAWPRAIRDQCQAAGVPFFFKQWGEWQLGSARGAPDAAVLDTGDFVFPDTQVGRECLDQKLGFTWHQHDPQAMARVGKKKAGRLLDGREWNELPNRAGVAHA